jgi:hypothetical protein
MAVKKKTATKAPAKKAAAKKAAPKKAKAPKEAKAKKTAPAGDVTADLDRKGLAARARQLKMELLAIRFNLQTPSLKDYRQKRKELASVLSRLS